MIKSKVYMFRVDYKLNFNLNYPIFHSYHFISKVFIVESQIMLLCNKMIS